MAKTPKSPTSFENAVTELDAIVQAMEADGLSLEQSLEHYQRGVELMRYCRSALDNAEQRIRVLQGNTLEDLPAGDEAR
ncbi:MAG: exodeoxyribonuclease VII small subunit [Rhodocyclaceae bacterium]|nr:exodeoxyribonuclease VII small subunit [Rhodocyclaceae bacterium]MCB1913724.1 exodeoxyribonuclease VII small subunit [Rhodocyclaceae bacterium]MCP5294614.1 exodeoxyribonuclease VII small subunit [Zoogloeaceae bacterium]MCW5617540.1 exodeoxyribonuclease VII small subunit [Rhodocyclaceae bacterium]